MSPHLYLVYFLICVKWSICYEYYDGRANGKRDVKKNVETKYNQGRKPKSSKDPNAQFDLAGFLNVDEEVPLGDGIFDYNANSGRNSKDYSDYGNIIDRSLQNIKKRDDSLDFLNGAYNKVESDVNPAEFSGIVNGRQFNMAGFNNNEKLIRNRDIDRENRDRENKAVTMKFQDDPYIDRSSVHNPEKKCAFRKMKFPFFSHNKSQTTKKEKKRKMLCINCKKEDAGTTSTESYDVKSKNKRSYIERLCPECQKKFRVELKEDLEDGNIKLDQRMVHNSRQYFAEINNQAKMNLDRQRLLQNQADDSSTNAFLSLQNARRKRDDFDDRDRRIKELDQIQRKVDNVEINLPQFEKQNQV